MAIHVYTGPSCPEPAVRAECPGAVVHPPARHGDLYSAAIRPHDSVVLLDGVYHHGPALRHKEILDALDRGVHVVGAASIGALRAVELAPFGMVGVGDVYGWYRDGVLTGDDEVAVAHADSGVMTPLSVPLVNLRAAAAAAVRAGVLASADTEPMLDRWAREYYPLRTETRVVEIAAEHGQPGFAAWYQERVRCDPRAFDQKLRDSVRALRVASAAQRDRVAAGPRPGAGDRSWRTEFERRWRNRFTGLAARLAYQQIFDPGFPEVWWEYLNDLAEPAGLRDHLERTLGRSAAAWPDCPEGRLRVVRLLCPTPELTDRRQAELLLGREDAADRSVLDQYLAQGADHLRAHPDRSLGSIPDAVCLRLLAGIWGVVAADATECARRGFASPRQAADALRPFAVGFLTAAAAAARGAGGEGG
ncbi:TfuA-like protein [Kitasatospora cineracea]|uniref:TfuA-like protein n=1 Tax=Kitasatospora cineracea TaxID=88074 RepID=UPI0037B678B3